MGSKKEIKLNKKGHAWPPVDPDHADLPEKPEKTKKEKAPEPAPERKRKGSKNKHRSPERFPEPREPLNVHGKVGWIVAAFSWAFFVTFWFLGVIH